MATANLPAPRKPFRKIPKPWESITAAHLMSRVDCDPITIMARIALNEIECSTCRGKLHTKYVLPDGQHTKACPGTSVDCNCHGIGERICQSCFGTGMEKVPPQLRYQAASELAKYKHPQFKQIENRESESNERQSIEIVLVRPAPRAIEPAAAQVEIVAATLPDEVIIDAEE